MIKGKDLKDLLLKIKDYIENKEEVIDGEWGHCRDLGKIIEDGDMPEIYNEICEVIEKLNITD